jgi:putative transposase
MVYDIDEQTIALQDKLKDKISDIKKTYKKDKKKMKAMIKTNTTKSNNQIDRLNKVTICKKIQIFPNRDQRIMLRKWFKECRRVYNYCIKSYKKNPNKFKKGYMKAKVKIFNTLYGDDEKGAPYAILTDEVRIFCSNLKSSTTNLKNGHIKKFDMKPKNVEKGQCIYLPKSAVKSDGFYLTLLGEMNGMDDLNDEEITHDCRLKYDRKHNTYTLLVPVDVERKVIENREKVVALDPGEKIFMSYYGLNDFGHIGKNIRDKILKIQEIISKYQKGISKRRNKQKKKLKGVKKLKNKINKLYEKLRNIRTELHNKTAKFLCEKYDMIMIPEFGTQQMVKNDIRHGIGKIKVVEAFEKDYEEGKEALKIYKKRKRLNKKVKFVLNMLSHYKFRQHLINKGNEYGCKIVKVTEEYTSKTCTKCGGMSEEYDKKREKTCKRCGYKIDRDVNGSRNILLKNLKEQIE